MSYVESNLAEGEKILYQTRLHPIIFAWPITFAAVGILIMIVFESVVGWGFILLELAAVTAIPPFIALKTSEFAVTNRRVLIKVGWLRRRSLELLLQKIESISVNQSLTGRIFNFGTIGVRGTGGTHETFSRIRQPLIFRRQVEALAFDNESAAATLSQRVPVRAALRAEETKKCPHCLSDIPAAAMVCRFCARDVVIP